MWSGGEWRSTSDIWFTSLETGLTCREILSGTPPIPLVLGIPQLYLSFVV